MATRKRKPTRKRTTKRTARKAPRQTTGSRKKTLQKAALIGGAGFIGYHLLKGNEASALPPIERERGITLSENDLDKKVSKEPVLPGIPSYTGSSSFPMRQGVTGILVKNLQRALLIKGGPEAAAHIQRTSMKPNGDVDGIFGPGTMAALQAAGWPYPINSQTYHAIVE